MVWFGSPLTLSYTTYLRRWSVNSVPLSVPVWSDDLPQEGV